ncbi:transmembrane [Plasmopara halstedii]|uniref:Transmembrane n=1 Tax=Plasmopara halstedii TaxID=4781 RepID=A0A0P1AEP3_PLAHL|nr:transmembrane [Plasmopara halstedii]CEG39033.1 transmembrane [Plasmopara halstedii]|eukprot:XP_024575402.1 transmembrane [Plasmopara halstedii]
MSCGSCEHDSVCAVIDYDGSLVSNKINRYENDSISISAKSSDPSYDRTFQRGTINYMSWRHIGLLVSTLSAGGLNTCLKRALLPLLEAELKMERYQVDAANVLLLLPWSYTFVGGFISDTLPILGSRRKAYIVLGWIVSLISCFAIAILNYTLEFKAQSSHVATEEALRQRVALIDWYVALLVLASFGCILTLVISETYVVAQTRREPLKMRGRALGTLLLTQFTGELVGQIVSDTAIFHISELGIIPLVSFRETAMFFMFYSLLPILALLFLFHEEMNPPAIHDVDADDTQSHIVEQIGNLPVDWLPRLRANWLRLRKALARKSTVYVIRFFMIYVFLSEFTLTYPHAQLAIWCNFTDKAQSSSNISSEVFYVLSVATWKYGALNWNWRYCVIISLIVMMMVPQLIFYIMASISINLRSQETYSFITALRGFVRASIIILEAAVCAEIAPVDGEGAFVGIIVSMSTIMRLLSTTFSNCLGYAFGKPSSQDTEEDADEVTFSLGICYMIKLLSVLALYFLPKQKRDLQRLHRYGAQGDTNTTWWVLGSLGCAFMISAAFNVLAVVPSTSCLQIVGGAGCNGSR